MRGEIDEMICENSYNIRAGKLHEVMKSSSK